ncbi:MAG TPA: hypothetical protein GXX46_01925 [Peptococcaceae bacterium]|nr:hypothetical protein [Peptococcaceae bacterium]
MDEETLLSLLESTGLRVAYHHYGVDEDNPPPEPPYLIYLFSHSSNFGADNKVYSKNPNYQVELYTIKKDPTTEKLIEDLFDEHDIYWEKTETYIESEGLYQVLYEI